MPPQEPKKESAVQPIALAAFLWCGVLATNATGEGSALCTGVLALLFSAFLLVPWRRQRDERYAKAYPVWQRAIRKWDLIFYCSRCDGIFFPGESRFVPVEQMQAYLKE